MSCFFVLCEKIFTCNASVPEKMKKEVTDFENGKTNVKGNGKAKAKEALVFMPLR